MNQSIKFVTKRGYLTSYAHRCGYLDVASIDDDAEAITMGHDGCYFVRMRPTETEPRVWECFDGPTARKDAHKFFTGLVRKHKALRKLNPVQP